MKQHDRLDRSLEALRLDQAPEVAKDDEGAELLALSRAIKRVRPANAVSIPPAPPLRARSHRRPLWSAAAVFLTTLAAIGMLVLWDKPVDVVKAAERELASLTTYHSITTTTATNVDPQTGGVRSSSWMTEIWFDRGKYRIQMGDDLVIFDGDTEWLVYASTGRVIKTPGLPKGRMRMPTVDELVRWFNDYPHAVEGEELFDGRPAYRVAVQLNAGLTQYVWLDKKTYLPLGGRTRQEDGGESAWTERMEINVPVDSALFTYEPPEGFHVEVRERR